MLHSSNVADSSLLSSYVALIHLFAHRHLKYDAEKESWIYCKFNYHRIVYDNTFNYCYNDFIVYCSKFYCSCFNYSYMILYNHC